MSFYKRAWVITHFPIGTNSGSKSVSMSPQSGMVKSWGLKRVALQSSAALASLAHFFQTCRDVLFAWASLHLFSAFFSFPADLGSSEIGTPKSFVGGGGPSLGLAHPHLQKEKALKGMFYLFLPEVVLVLALPRVVGASQPGHKAFTRLF